MGKRSGGYRVLVSRNLRILGRPRRRWDDNKMDIQGTGWRHGLDWIGQGRDTDNRLAVLNTVMNLRVPYNFLS
jgi:hypothetical protein